MNMRKSSIRYVTMCGIIGVCLGGRVLFAQSSAISVTSGSWDNPSTWDCSCVPGSNTSVTISAGHTVTLASNPTKVRNLTVNGVLKFPSTPAVYLSVYGNITIGSNGNMTGNVYLRIMSLANRKFFNNSSNTISIVDFRKETAYDFEFRSGSFVIKRQLLVTNGGSVTINPSASVTLASSSTLTSRVEPVNGSINGTFRVERYISSRPADYADLASPVTNTTFNDWDQELYMSGVNGNDGNACYNPGCTSIYYSVYRWDNVNQQYDTVKDVNDPIPHGYGIELFLGDDLNNYNGGTFNSIGTLHVGNKTISSGSLGANVGDWNLLGNPYHCWIKWNDVTKTNLKNEVWIYNANSSSYQLYSGSNILIPSSQGFWVETSGANPSCTFTESSKYISASSTFYKTDENAEQLLEPDPLISDDVRLQEREYLAHEAEIVVKEPVAGFRNQTYLRPHPDALLSKDVHDASLLKLKNKLAPEIYTLSADHQKLGLNTFNPDKEVSVPLIITSKTAGVYEIEINGIQHFSPYYEQIIMKDEQTNEIYDLTSIPALKKYLGENETRNFTLHFFKTKKESPRFNTNHHTSVALYESAGGEVYISLPQVTEEVKVQAYNLLGQEIYPTHIFRHVSSFSLGNLNHTGIVLIKMEINGISETHKLHLTK